MRQNSHSALHLYVDKNPTTSANSLTRITIKIKIKKKNTYRITERARASLGWHWKLLLFGRYSVLTTGWTVRGLNPGSGKRVFSSRKGPDRLCGAPSRFHFNLYRDSLPGIKRPGRDVDHSPPPSTEIMNERSHTCTPPLHAFTAWTRKT